MRVFRRKKNPDDNKPEIKRELSKMVKEFYLHIRKKTEIQLNYD